MALLTVPKRILIYVLTVFVVIMALHFVEIWQHPRDVLSQIQSKAYRPGESSGSVGLVIASRRDDDTSWIYQPFSEWTKFVYVLDDEKAALSVPANKGESAMAYLTHIIDNYDHLDDTIIFHHASRYQWHNDDPNYDAKRLLSRLNIPYIESQGYHNLRCVWKLGCGHDAIRLHSSNVRAHNVLTKNEAASNELDGLNNKRQQLEETSDLDIAADADVIEANDEMEADHSWDIAADSDGTNQNDEMNEYGQSVDTGPEYIASDGDNGDDALVLASASSHAGTSAPPIPTIPAGPPSSWDKNATFHDAFQQLLPGAPVPHSISSPCCAQFAVTRKTIRQRPKAHYERYRTWLIETDLEDEISSRVMEKLWHIIFGRPANDCPDAPSCYCSLYGLCNLECENLRSCASQWRTPGKVIDDGS